MSNKSNAYSSSTAYIRDLSYAKISQYYQSTKDNSIRKYVLITNVLRHTHIIDSSHHHNNSNEQQPYYYQEDLMEICNDDSYNDSEDDALEQQWLDSCLNELEEDELQSQSLQQEQQSTNSRSFGNYSNHDKNDKEISEEQSTKLYFHAGVVACLTRLNLP
ncbi:hypothetical protein INT45_007334 [Circinella minor]|uniref:Uncharacterized protein n=1 Tax=Circinella minor TaxID=1195481 RepID=A0A8H7S2T4_9FUNG|nr:hypothetical protein INT45_007334 [Circinella minor]